MPTRKHPQQNPKNKNEYWCGCPKHQCYLPRHCFGNSAKNKLGIATICKEHQKGYMENHKRKKGVCEAVSWENTKAVSLDRSKWSNYRQYLIDNPGYCHFLLHKPYDEDAARKVFNEVAN